MMNLWEKYYNIIWYNNNKTEDMICNLLIVLSHEQLIFRSKIYNILEITKIPLKSASPQRTSFKKDERVIVINYL